MNTHFKDLLDLDRFTITENEFYKEFRDEVTFRHTKAGYVLLIFREKEILFFNSFIGEDIMRLPLLEGHINDQNFTARIETYWHDSIKHFDECDNKQRKVEFCDECKSISNKRLLINFVLTHPRVFEVDPDYNKYKDIVFNNLVLDALKKKYICMHYRNNQDIIDKNVLCNATFKWLNICISDQEDNKLLFNSSNSVFNFVEDEVDAIYFNNGKLSLKYLESPTRDEKSKLLTKIIDEGRRWYISRRYLIGKTQELSWYRLSNSGNMYPNEYPFLTFMPRLIGAIIVGYLPLVLSPEVWGITAEFTKFNSNWLVELPVPFLTYILVIIGCFVLALMYNYIEIRNYVKNVKNKFDNESLSQKQPITKNHSIFKRAFIITSTGLFYSFCCGFITIVSLTDLMTYQLQKRGMYEIELNTRSLIEYSLLSSILWAPIALCIGLFLQILWEDKPITDPL